MFNQELSEYKHEHVRPITLEFEKAVERGAVSPALAQKYMRALNTYAAKIRSSPGSPLWGNMRPGDDDAALRQGSAKELEWVSAERAHVGAQVGGVLPVDGE
jgi:hypothetical protein